MNVKEEQSDIVRRAGKTTKAYFGFRLWHYRLLMMSSGGARNGSASRCAYDGEN